MVEAGSNEVTEDDMLEALAFAYDAIKVISAEIERFAKKAGKEKRVVSLKTIDEGLKKAIDKKYGKEIEKTLLGAKDKAMRESALDDLIKDIVSKMKPDYADQPESTSIRSCSSSWRTFRTTTSTACAAAATTR